MDGADRDSGVEPDAAGPVPQQFLLVVRPRRIAIYACISAAAVVSAMVVIGLLLRDANEGVQFRTSDQISLIGLGLLIGAAILSMARPRLRVGETGIWVRNVFGERYFPWQLVLRIAFPEGANWAQVLLADDESHPLMAIQAMDKQRAVTALQQLRELHRRYAPEPPKPAPAPRAADPERPLGRLEKIDREMAAKNARKPRRRRPFQG